MDNPAVVVQIRLQVFAGIARPAAASERSRLWERMVRVLPRYLAYEQEAGRELPVVVIEAVRDR